MSEQWWNGDRNGEGRVEKAGCLTLKKKKKKGATILGDVENLNL